MEHDIPIKDKPEQRHPEKQHKPDNPIQRKPEWIRVRMGASPDFSGRGIVVAFLDSGFFAHPDLTQPEDRILAYVDLTGGNGRPRRGRTALP